MTNRPLGAMTWQEMRDAYPMGEKIKIYTALNDSDDDLKWGTWIALDHGGFIVYSTDLPNTSRYILNPPGGNRWNDVWFFTNYWLFYAYLRSYDKHR